MLGGGSGIRTLEGVAPLLVFKTSAFDRSANPPGTVRSRSSARRHRSGVQAGSFKSLFYRDIAHPAAGRPPMFEIGPRSRSGVRLRAVPRPASAVLTGRPIGGASIGYHALDGPASRIQEGAAVRSIVPFGCESRACRSCSRGRRRGHGSGASPLAAGGIGGVSGRPVEASAGSGGRQPVPSGAGPSSRGAVARSREQPSVPVLGCKATGAQHMRQVGHAPFATPASGLRAAGGHRRTDGRWRCLTASMREHANGVTAQGRRSRRPRETSRAGWAAPDPRRWAAARARSRRPERSTRSGRVRPDGCRCARPVGLRTRRDRAARTHEFRTNDPGDCGAGRRDGTTKSSTVVAFGNRARRRDRPGRLPQGRGARGVRSGGASRVRAGRRPALRPSCSARRHKAGFGASRSWRRSTVTARNWVRGSRACGVGRRARPDIRGPVARRACARIRAGTGAARTE